MSLLISSVPFVIATLVEMLFPVDDKMSVPAPFLTSIAFNGVPLWIRQAMLAVLELLTVIVALLAVPLVNVNSEPLTIQIPVPVGALSVPKTMDPMARL